MPDVIDRLRLDHRRMAAVLTALRSAVRRDPGDIPEISRGNLLWGIDHARRRVTHVAEGWRRSNVVALGAMERLQAPR